MYFLLNGLGRLENRILYRVTQILQITLLISYLLTKIHYLDYLENYYSRNYNLLHKRRKEFRVYLKTLLVNHPITCSYSFPIT